MSLKKASVTIEGLRPLLMHNGQLADPLNGFAQELGAVTKKKTKTEADHRVARRLEALGGLWLYNGEPCIPLQAVESAFVMGAKRRKLGKDAAIGFECDGHAPLIYEGPRKPEELVDTEGFVLTCGAKVAGRTVMRSRPLFRDWRAAFGCTFDDRVLNPKTVREILEIAGEVIGLGDWRPKFGRFQVMSFDLL